MNLSRRGFLRALGLTSAVIALPTLWLPEAAGRIVTTGGWVTVPHFNVVGDLADPGVRDAVVERIQASLMRSLTDPTNPRQPEAARVLTEWMHA